MKQNFFLQNNNSVFIVAELSANHNGSLEVAVETIKAAKRAGADAIKLQTYTADTMTLNLTTKDFIINNGSIWDGENFYSLYKRAHTPWSWHKTLFRIAKEEGLICFSTPFDHSAVDFLEDLENPIYKIASFEITDLPLIKYVARKNKPIILSTGIATKNEIDEAVKAIRAIGNNKIAILKCTSSYPAPVEEANLVMIKELQRTFDIIPGLSDHTLGTTIPVAATILGAKIIEKHFILDKSIGGPDASFSLDENEFKQMVTAIRDAEKSIGSITYSLTEKQKKGRLFSRSLFVVKNVKKGDKISNNNIRSLRPEKGISPKHLPTILGKTFKSDFKKGTPLKFSMIIDASH
tara:strand:+ start:5957 stop:7006 length:1050 start_codon:yes stop_codon:yes gene_type:complete